MSPRISGGVVLAIVVAMIAGLAYFAFLSVPQYRALPGPQVSSPTPSNSSGTVELNGTTYSYTSESLFGNQSWLNYSYRAVKFGFHLWCQVTVDVGYVCGNATESSGASFHYSFTEGLPVSNQPPPWQTWVAPTGHEAVQYQQGGTARLLVAG